MPLTERSTHTRRSEHKRVRRRPNPLARAKCLGIELLEDRRLMAVTPGSNLSNGTQLTTFTLALATTAEFTQSAGGKAATKALLNQIVSEMNKNYESELAISFQLHPQNDRLIFENAATDGYTNGSVTALIAENPIVINTTLNGSPTNDSGYDFGHVLGLGNDGGLASIGTKARGATDLLFANASNNSIKSFAHELAHQLNASHSFNGVGRECGPNRNPLTAVEPGSGSSLLSYQGICDSDNLPDLPGDGTYLHAVSFDEMVTYLTGTIANVGTKVSTGNTIPTVNAGPDRTIPASTPFLLTATASDPNVGDTLTYTWDQIDALSPAGVPVPIANSLDRSGPLFRSYAPTADPFRSFPRIEDLAANVPINQNKNEHLPTQNRDLNFRVTVRDNHLFNGRAVSGVSSDDVKLTVVNTGSPFRITTLNSASQTITGGSQHTITWDVAGTTANGINASRVDILLSVDGGRTYPLKLVSQTGNDGSETVTVPNVAAAKARIKVQADPTQNVFFDINDADFQITQDPNASGGIAVAESSGVTKVAEGLAVQLGLPATDSYTVSLTKPPTGDVEVTVTGDSQIQASVDGVNFATTQTITFTAGDAGPKTVTVKATNDTSIEGLHLGTVRQGVTRSNDPKYSPQILLGTVVQPVAVNISDDESPPVIGVELDFEGQVSVPINWTRIESPFGINASNLVRDNGEPTTADLAITIASTAGGAGWSFRTMDPTTIPRHSPDISLIDDTMYWVNTSVTAVWSDLKPNSKYRVYVFAASEADVDGEAPIKQTITITGNGNDNPAPFLQDGTGMITGFGQFKQLQLFVNGAIGSHRNPLEQYGLIVTSTAEGKVQVRVDPANGGHSALSALAIQEFLEPGPDFSVLQTNGKTEVTEAGTTDTFSVTLSSQPASNVVFNVTSANTAEANVDKATVTFTPQNWDTPQTVTVTGVDDSVLDGDQTTNITVAVNAAQSDSRYGSLPAQSVQVTTKENDVAGITIVETAGKTEVTEAGGTDTFSVALTAQPPSNVVLNVSSGNTNEASIDIATLTFSPQNWNVAQVVTATGVDDQRVDGDVTSQISVSVNAAQSASVFGSAPSRTVQVTTKDDDQPGFQIAETDGKTEVNETTLKDTITVVLSKQPLSDVNLNVSSAVIGQATVDKATLTFTPANWNVAQTVTISGKQDFRIDGDQTVSVTVAVNAATSNSRFAGVAAQSVSVLVVDSGLLPAWQNPGSRFDVSGDGKVVPLDVLQIINELNDPQFNGQLPDERPPGAAYYDVNGDGFVTTNDALQVINFLNSQPTAEGERVAAFAAVFAEDDDEDSIFDEIAADIVRARRANVRKGASVSPSS